MNPALDVLPVRVIVLFGKCGPLVENALVVAGAVDDDVEVLLDENLGQCPLKLVGMLCHLVERDAGFEKTGSEHVVINDHSTNISSEQCRYRTLPGT